MDYSKCNLIPLTEEAAKEISQWKYEMPYECYSFQGRPNGYLMNKETWGVEQFRLVYQNELIGQVACQYEQGALWVGWSLTPKLCGKGGGHLFVRVCAGHIRQIKGYKGKIYLRVAKSNERAVKAYQKAGFVCLKTIRDSVAYQDQTEDFFIIVLDT